MKRKGKYPEILPNKGEWPIVQLSKNRKKFLKEVSEEVFQNIRLKNKGSSIRDEIETTVYREKLRMRANPWRVDPRDEKPFWQQIQSELTDTPNNAEGEKKLEELLLRIIDRYANEIVGNFKKSYYRFAVSFVTFGFARLLNASRVKGFGAIFSRQLDLNDKIHIEGEVEHIRSLARKGTVVMVPTHFSNLDSILIGWVIQFLGLPAFIYGAGLNLFNIKILAYFMNSLGAYKVDRRKKNPVYLETLKTYSSLALRWGCHSLFFPGGTRGRSGQLETNLKLGLLGTTIEAQRIMFQQQGEQAKKIFIVPVVINYQFTLEAPLLINEHLKSTGQERYYRESDEFSNSRKITSFLIKFFFKGSNMSVTIGRGMDILGNYVDDEGHSSDQNGNPIHTRDYFVSNGKITVDEQREQTYVRLLGKRIVEDYYKNNRVFPSHVVAYTAFKMLERNHPELDLYAIMRLPDESLALDYEEFKKRFKDIRKRVNKLHKKGKIGVEPSLNFKAEIAIKEGLENVGMYHAARPLIRKKHQVIVQEPSTLYYYHNRLEGYGLEKHI